MEKPTPITKEYVKYLAGLNEEELAVLNLKSIHTSEERCEVLEELHNMVLSGELKAEDIAAKRETKSSRKKAQNKLDRL